MKPMSKHHLLLGACLTVMALACGGSSVGEPNSTAVQMVDAGSWDVHERWPHDGHPVEGDTFIVYSDAAGPEARQEMLDAAERLWAGLLEELEVESSMLQFASGQEKIDIYAYHDRFPQGWSGRAYYGGLLIWAPDHPLRQFDRDGYEPVLKHELVHVLQWMLTGGRGTIDTWFIEGRPRALARDLSGPPIVDLGQLSDLTAEYGEVNPISIERYSQITDPEAGEHFFYPMFQLAFEYLLDDDGLGRSPVDARDVMVDMAEGEAFDVAFERHMRLSVEDFEEQFFDLMNEYLPQDG